MLLPTYVSTKAVNGNVGVPMAPVRRASANCRRFGNEAQFSFCDVRLSNNQGSLSMKHWFGTGSAVDANSHFSGVPYISITPAIRQTAGLRTSSQANDFNGVTGPCASFVYVSN